MFDEILANAKECNGTIIQKLENYMINFSGYIEKSSVKLAQEWIKNVVDPDITDVGTNKLHKDLSAVTEILKSGIRAGLLKDNAPVKQLADTINDLLYGQMLCWAMSGGVYSFEERTKKFCKTYLNILLKQYLS